MLLHYPLDILDDNDGIIDHDADRQHDRKKGYSIGGIANRKQHDEGADQTDRYRESGDQCCANVSEEEKYNDHHENKRFQERFLNLVQCVFDESCRIVGDLPGQVFGKPLFKLCQLGFHRVEGFDRVGPRRLIDCDRRRGSAIQSCLPVEIRRAQFEFCHIAQPENRTVRIRPDHNLFELGNRAQPALGLNVKLKLLLIRYRPGANSPDRGLDILRLDGVDDVSGRQVKTGQTIGTYPGAHGVVLRTPQRRITYTGSALDLIQEVDGHVVRQIERIVRALRRGDRHDAKQGRRFLLDDDALPLSFLEAGSKARSAHGYLHLPC